MKVNLSAALRHLFAAIEHSIAACQRTRDMVARAIARYITLASQLAGAQP